MIDRFERFSYALAEISRCWHKLAAEEMSRYGLKGPHCIYLVVMMRHPDGITAPQLCDACGKDKADVSRMMALLCKKGLVSKEGDYRAAYRLTSTGLEAAQRVQAQAVWAVEEAGRDLTDDTRRIFYDALESIANQLRRLCEEGLPPRQA